MYHGCEGMPLATTSSVLLPRSIVVGTWNLAETILVPVATPIVLKSCVVA
jgi:hypothetical protein